mgnify:CR=1 FL=1
MQSSEADDQLWTQARFKYEFFLCLTKVKVPNRSSSIAEDARIFLNDYKYYSQARKLRPWIPLTRPKELVTSFVINLSDLSPRCKEEFLEFCKLNNKHEIGFFLKEIAIKFFENIDYDYAHDSILSHLKVRVEE